jgi:hypothetical protein
MVAVGGRANISYAPNCPCNYANAANARKKFGNIICGISIYLIRCKTVRSFRIKGSQVM